MVQEVKDLGEFRAFLAGSGDKLVVVDFTASWCGPCKMIGPKFVEMSQEAVNANVVFLKVDVDEADDVSEECGISCMPTFHFYRNGAKVAEFSGANEASLRAKLEELRG